MIDENKLIEIIEEAFYEEKYISRSAKEALADVICIIDNQPKIKREEIIYKYLYGFPNESNVTSCPRCGAEILNFYEDETAYCKECGFHFGVVECEEE